MLPKTLFPIAKMEKQNMLETQVTKTVETDIDITLHEVRQRDGSVVPVSEFWADSDNDLIIEVDASMVTGENQKMLEYLERNGISTYDQLVKMVNEIPPF